MSKKQIGVYYIKCIENNKLYIGSSNTSIKRRFNEHRYALRKNKHANKHLQNAWNKYGEEKFIFDIIEACKSNQEVLNKEAHYICILGTTERSIGFNKTKNTENPTLGTKWSEETRKKRAEAFKKVKWNRKGRKCPWAKKQLPKMHAKIRKKVKCIELDKTFESITEAAKFIGGTSVGMSHVCNGKWKQYKGYHWEFVAEGDK